MTSADPVIREKRRNVEAEALEATQAPPGPERAKRLRSCKTEAVGTAKKEASPSNLRRKTRRSSHV